LANGLLVIAAIVATWLAGEAVFALVGLRYVPLRLQEELPPDVRVFAQSSKSGVVPRDPVVLLGDSYAQGLGDWLLDADPDRNGPFASAHIIHALTARDVITLGQSGAGSPEGMAALPAIAYARTRDAWYLRLPRPSVAVVYFFEGNDLNNNMRFLQRRVESADAADLAGRIDRALAAYPAALSADDTDWRRHFPLLRLSVQLAQRFYVERTAHPQTRAPAQASRLGQPNIAEVAGHVVDLPDGLQSPALELTPAEIDRSVLVFERSLVYLRKLLGDAPILIAYVPSPLSSYRLLGTEVSIEQYLGDRGGRYPRERVAQYSDVICGLIRAAAVRNGAGFLDLRPALRAASARDVVHGPRDFKHFNRKGMEALGQAIAARVDHPLAPDACWAGQAR
jgi:hypothetical protein